MMLQRGKIVLLLVALSSTWGAVVPVDAVTIAENGLAQAVIVIAQDAPKPEQHAASELADFLQQVTGASFEIMYPPAAGK